MLKGKWRHKEQREIDLCYIKVKVFNCVRFGDNSEYVGGEASC